MLSKEDCFVVECVPGFCDALLADLLQESYDLVCLRICQSQFGIPVTRDRKYMLFTSKAMRWDSVIADMGHQEAFDKFFGRRVLMRGDEMLRASPAEVQTVVNAMALARGYPETRSSGRPWSMWLAMSRAQHNMLKEQEESLVALG